MSSLKKPKIEGFLHKSLSEFFLTLPTGKFIVFPYSFNHGTCFGTKIGTVLIPQMSKPSAMTRKKKGMKIFPMEFFQKYYVTFAELAKSMHVGVTLRAEFAGAISFWIWKSFKGENPVFLIFLF